MNQAQTENENENEKENSTNANRNRVFAAISIVLGLVFAVIVTEWGLGIYFQRLQSQAMDPGFMRYHPQLGWSLSPGWSGQHSHYDYQATYNLGLDGFREQPPKPGSAATAQQIAMLGDSFTFGLGVQDNETFTSVLNTSSDAEFINYGVPGTSTDQQLLLLNQLMRRDPPDQVVLILYLPNDILDNTLDYPLQAEQAKPFFALNNGELELENVPVPRVAKPARLRATSLGSVVLDGFDAGESWLDGLQLGRMLDTVLGGRAYDGAELQPVLASNLEPALTLFSALLSEMADLTRRNQAKFRLVLLPGRDAVINDSGISYHYQDYLRQEVLMLAAAADIPTIDLMTEIAAQSREEIGSYYFPNDGHLTPAGHRLVAGILERQLTE